MTVVFSQYPYIPCLQCSEAESMAYAKLTNEDKESILPIFEINQIKNESSFSDSIESLKKLIPDRPFILDISKVKAPDAHSKKGEPLDDKGKKIQKAQNSYNNSLAKVLSPTNGFANWRDIASNFPNAVPVLQFSSPEIQGKEILREASQFQKKGFSQIAIRIDQETSEEVFFIIGQVIAILDDPSQLFIIVDCEQGRQKISERAEFAKKAISSVLEQVDSGQRQNVSAVCLSDGFTSLKSTPVKFHNMISRELWAKASEIFPFIYGDYGANHRRKSQTTYIPPTWKAQVFYPCDDGWIVYQHENAQDPQGWIDGANIIKKMDKFDGACDCWGSNLLESAAGGDIAGCQSARYWYASKINMHIHRQIKIK